MPFTLPDLSFGPLALRGRCGGCRAELEGATAELHEQRKQARRFQQRQKQLEEDIEAARCSALGFPVDVCEVIFSSPSSVLDSSSACCAAGCGLRRPTGSSGSSGMPWRSWRRRTRSCGALRRPPGLLTGRFRRCGWSSRRRRTKGRRCRRSSRPLRLRLEAGRRARKEQDAAAAAAASHGDEEELEAEQAVLDRKSASEAMISCTHELSLLVAAIRAQLEEGGDAMMVLMDDAGILNPEERRLLEAFAKEGGGVKAQVPAAAVAEVARRMSSDLKGLRNIICDKAAERAADDCVIQ